jgi:drug/metabolite transporter (DMT)-like permease
VTLGIITAIAAGASFATAGVLQQRVAATRPRDEVLSFRLIVDLAKRRMWLAGIAFAVLSYVLQALALSAAPLSVVQPILVTEVLFAIPVSVRLHRMRLHAREWAAVVAVAGGLALAILAAAPRPGHPIVPIAEWAPVLGVVVVLAALSLAGGRVAGGVVRPASFALAAALVMSLEAALMSATTRRFEHGITAGFTAWEPYAMAVCSITGMLLIQSAFQAGPLATTMPVTDAVQPIASIGIGLALFHEHVATTTGRLATAAAALAGLFAGIVVLDTSPVVHRVHQDENEQKDQQDDSSTGDERPASHTYSR